jgi:glutathione S-transferase
MTPIALSGAPGSPYTRKMLAVLRYRRIPYRFLPSEGPLLADLPRPKVRLLPTFYLPGPDGGLEAVTDSTPLIRRFEKDFAGRSVIPGDPALAFLDALLEDYGDEWLTKAMFHYRWRYEADIAKAGSILPLWRDTCIPDEAHAAVAKMIRERQISRLYVVGSNDITAPVIEGAYARFLTAFETHLKTHRFLLGARPGSADFALCGQLTQLARFDPTPMALALKLAPRVSAWTDVVEDLSGLEPTEADWIDPANLPGTLIALLHEMGRTYVPVMLANARAVASGAAEVETEVEGLPWRQPPFPYQAKCLTWLRGDYQALPAAARAMLDPVFEKTGLAPLFA